MTKILLNAPLVSLGGGRANLAGMTDPKASKKGWRVYSNKCWGKIAYAFGFAIKAEYKINGKTEVWYINTNSFAKRSVNLSFLTDENVKNLVAKIRKKHALPPLPKPVVNKEENREVPQEKEYLPQTEIQGIVDCLKTALIICLDDQTKDETEKAFKEICEEALRKRFVNKLELFAFINLKMDLHPALNSFARNTEKDIFQIIENQTPEVVPPADPKKIEQEIDRLKERLIANMEQAFPGENNKKLRDENIEYFRQICELFKDASNLDELRISINEAMTTYKKIFAEKEPETWLLDGFNDESNDYNIFLIRGPQKKAEILPPEEDKSLGAFNFLKNNNPIYTHYFYDPRFEKPSAIIIERVNELFPRVESTLQIIFDEGKDANIGDHVTRGGEFKQYSDMSPEEEKEWLKDKKLRFLELCFEFGNRSLDQFHLKLIDNLQDDPVLSQFCDESRRNIFVRN